jgi:hypothetical protein
MVQLVVGPAELLDHLLLFRLHAVGRIGVAHGSMVGCQWVVGRRQSLGTVVTKQPIERDVKT